jgi:hypothetical protein
MNSPPNADSARDKRLEPDSNVTIERDLHLQKHHLPRLSIEAGMQIDESDEQLEMANSPRAISAPSRLISRTSTRTPPSETKFRGKMLSEPPEKVQDAVLPSDLYVRSSIEIKSTLDLSVGRSGRAESF